MVIDDGLKSTFGGYFHNIWPELFGTWEMVIHTIIDDYDVASLQEDITEMEEILAAGHPNAYFEKNLHRKYGANIHPPGFGFTHKEWFTTVLGMFKEGLQKKQSGTWGVGNNYPELKLFMASTFFGGVWDEEKEEVYNWERNHDTWQGAVAAQVQAKEKGKLIATYRDLQRLIDQNKSEAELRPILQWKLGADIYPPVFNTSFGEFFAQVKKVLKEEMERKGIF